MDGYIFIFCVITLLEGF